MSAIHTTIRTVPILRKKLEYKGKIAILVVSVGAPCHEDRARGAKDTIAKYKDMEIVATEYDMDSVDMAYDLTIKILQDHPDLDGIVCCNMSNPVGYAVFEKDDKYLSDVFERADRMMYERKKELKAMGTPTRTS